MCISTKIQQKIQQKAELDAQIAKLEKLEASTAPVKSLLSELLADYAKEAPEDLAAVWEEVLAIGGQHNLSVQPLAADEVKAEEIWVKDTIAPNLRKLHQEALTENIEPEEDAITIEDVLIVRGFFQPPNLEHFDTGEKYETYRGWDIYYSVPNGGVTAIGLYNSECNQLWDASTEVIEELDSTFPESLANFDKICAWTRAVIDRVENLEAPGHLALEFPDPTSEQIEEELGCNGEDEDGVVTPEPTEKTDTERYRNFNQIFELQDFKVDVRQHNKGDEFAGASFNFYEIRENQPTICQDNLSYSKSLTATECANKSPQELATEIIEVYWQKLREKKEKEADPYKKPEDDFIELVKLTPAVGYLKRRDNGELLSAYAAFANRDAAGEKTATMAKVRAKKWAEHLHSSFESCGWKVEEPRKINRMAAEPGAKQQFAYEIKITGKFSIGQLQKLAEEDLSLLPNESAPVSTVHPAAPVEVPPNQLTYRIKINSYEMAKGSEQEMRSRFEEELKILGGSQMSVSLMLGSEAIESYRVNDFEFTPVEDFDAANPEYQVVHLRSQKTFKVYKRVTAPPELDGWTNTVYPYTPGFSKREAAAADAVRRLLKAESAE